MHSSYPVPIKNASAFCKNFILSCKKRLFVGNSCRFLCEKKDFLRCQFTPCTGLQVAIQLDDKIPDGRLLAADPSAAHVEESVQIGDAVYARMSAADALVLPSTFEPYGAVVGEALQWGTPCVVSDMVGARMLISDVNGAIYPSNDSSVFATSIAKAFACKVGTDSLLSGELQDAVENYLFKLQA